MSILLEKCEYISKAVGCDFKVCGANVLTTFKGGGNACVFCPDDEQSFAFLYGVLCAEIGKPFILGGGSDTVIADGLCKIPVISTCRLNSVKVVDDKKGKVYAGCGAYIKNVTSAFRKLGFGGFEFLSGVPATVGGAVRMNASAFGSETAHYIDNIRILSAECDKNSKYEIKTIGRDNLKLGYRKGASDIILGATFNADNIDGNKSRELAKRYLEARVKKQPKYPSCGSVFKNGDVPSGKLIEDCGLKGVRKGGAQISEMHGNFIINTGGATADDFMSLVRLAEERVFEKYGIKPEREFVYLK